MKRNILLFSVFLAQLALGQDSDVFHWRPNSNWNNPSNWRAGSPPCGGQVASFSDNSVVYLNENINIQTIILPENGQIILGANVAINLSEESSCEDGPAPGSDQNVPSTAPTMNKFVGNRPHYWECSDNWMTPNNLPASRAPCGRDIAVFERDSYFHFVRSNETVYIRSLQVRGQEIITQSDLDENEFQININIVPDCATDPTQCPCLSNQGCIQSPELPIPMGASSGPVIAGVVIAVICLLIVAVIIVVIVIIVVVRYKRQTIFSYKMDNLIDPEEQDKKAGLKNTSNTIDNPVYESITPGDIQSQENPTLSFQPSDPEPVPDESHYEVEHDDNFIKVDLGALNESTVGDEPSDYFDAELEEAGKKKGKKAGKYERF